MKELLKTPPLCSKGQEQSLADGGGAEQSERPGPQAKDQCCDQCRHAKNIQRRNQAIEEVEGISEPMAIGRDSFEFLEVRKPRRRRRLLRSNAKSELEKHYTGELFDFV